MTVNTLGTHEQDRTSRTAAEWLWPLLPIGVSVFFLSSLIYYHVRHDAIEARSALQMAVAGVYRIAGFAPAVLCFLLALTWSSIWFATGQLERPVSRVLRLLAMTLMLGYFPASRLGLGEDIPARIALQWASRRSPDLRPNGIGPGYARVQALLDRCAALQRPALIVSISDDAFATEGGVKRLLSYYPRLFPLERIMYTPADAGTRRIGHFGLFGRRAGAALWPRLLAQLEPSPN